MPIGILLFVLLVAGCAHEDYWTQKGKPEPDMQLDRFQCETELREKYGFYGADQRGPAYVNDLRQCMIAKGYTLHTDKK